MSHLITHTVGQKPPGVSLFRRLAAGISASLAGYKVFTVPNLAMLPTLRERDIVPLDESAYRTEPILRADVVVYRSTKYEGTRLPCRVIGLPGELIELKDGVLYINGFEVLEPYVENGAAEQPHSKHFGPVEVPADCVFLMGDFRDLSEDSRFLGPVTRDRVVGRIVSTQGA